MWKIDGHEDTYNKLCLRVPTWETWSSQFCDRETLVTRDTEHSTLKSVAFGRRTSCIVYHRLFGLRQMPGEDQIERR